jgi:streptomycin 6-kinase
MLKVGMPHMEAAQEIDGLRFWAGEATVLLLESDAVANAMLLERCEPGDSLFSVPENEQDLVIAATLKRLWKTAPAHSFRPLSVLLAHWRHEAEQNAAAWSDPGLAREGLEVLSELAADGNDAALLATDLHAGNILRAQREPWLMIDPKPFVGDRAYDLTQHLLNCEERLRRDPKGLVRRMAELADVDECRLSQWLFGRAAAEPRSDWGSDWKLQLARRLSI